MPTSVLYPKCVILYILYISSANQGQIGCVEGSHFFCQRNVSPGGSDCCTVPWFHIVSIRTLFVI